MSLSSLPEVDQVRILKIDYSIFGKKFVDLVHRSFDYDLDKTEEFLCMVGSKLYMATGVCPDRKLRR